KIEKAGTPLKDWEIQINYGIKTGFNEAFIIDESTKNELILEDFKSAEIIKPILRGRDIKRYYADYANLYLISTFPALKLDIENYPAVKKYLLSFAKERLEQLGNVGSRKKTGNKWFEIQDQISYHEEFAKEKIVWASIGETHYSFVAKNMLLLDTNYFCTFKTDKINKYILCVLNSKAIIRYVNSIDTQVGEVAHRHYKYNFEKIPIPQISEENQQIFIEKADLMLNLNKKLQEISQKVQRNLLREFSLTKLNTKLENWYKLSFADFLKELEKQKIKLKLSQKTEWEKYFAQAKAHATEISAQILQTDQQIDALVYELYNLNREEIEIVEKM
ncbi:MAG: N-6 DNA methylase, partial [Bacteroidetes bacterium]